MNEELKVLMRDVYDYINEKKNYQKEHQKCQPKFKNARKLKLIPKKCKCA